MLYPNCSIFFLKIYCSWLCSLQAPRLTSALELEKKPSTREDKVMQLTRPKMPDRVGDLLVKKISVAEDRAPGAVRAAS